MKRLLLLLFFISIVCTDIYSQEVDETQARLVKITNPFGNGAISNINEFGQQVVFWANDGDGIKLWVSDGTESGSEVISEFTPVGLAVNGDLIIFRQDPEDVGREPFISDGTLEGTMLLKDINEGPDDSNSSNFTPLGSGFFFTANDGVSGTEPYYTDGTPSGTILLKDINPGPGNSSPVQISAIGDYVYFSANDGENGTQLWRTDGTPSGTELVVMVNESGNSAPFDIQGFNDDIIFRANDGTGNQLWRYNPSMEELTKISDLSGAISQVSVAGGLIYFRGNDGDGNEPFVSEGTLASTRQLKIINPTGNSNPIRFITIEGSLVVFVANDGETGNEMWVTDGTEDGTFQLLDINPGGGSSTPNFPVVLNGELYFRADDGNSAELWKTDGSTENTVKLTEINKEGGSAGVNNLLVSGETIFFGADDGINSGQFWRYGVPEIEISFNGAVVENNGDVSIVKVLSEATSDIVFEVNNNGPVALKLFEISISFTENIFENISLQGPVLAGEFSQMIISTDIQAPGDYSFSFDLRSDDMDNSTYTINVELIIEEDPVAGISGRKLDSQIYPNPTQGILNIENNSRPIAGIRIINLQGQTVLGHESGQARGLSIDINHLNAGVYILELTYGDGKISRDRVIKN